MKSERQHFDKEFKVMAVKLVSYRQASEGSSGRTRNQDGAGQTLEKGA